jgi:surfeit locus 1 family protein
MATSSRRRGRAAGRKAKPIRRQGFPYVMTLFVLAAMALLVGLGVWQIKRLHWKEQLLASIATAETEPPQPLRVVLGQGADGLPIDYRRVMADCPDIETTPFVRLYALQDAVSGYRIITACRLDGGAYGSILVDRGFISEDDAARLKPGAGRTLDGAVVGVLRHDAERNPFTPQNQPNQGLWYWRDIPAIAASLGAPKPAPVFLMLESPAPKGIGPRPAPVPTNIPNNHLGYAVTWFGLALTLAGVYLAVLWRRRAG